MNRKGTVNEGDSDLLGGFDRFWKLYPKQRDRQKALKAWNKLKPNAALQETMLASLARHVASHDWRKDGGQYIPHPTTWLNGQRWEDEVGNPSPLGPSSNFTNLPTHTPDMYQEAPDGQSDF